ncbi:MAG: patatin family protein, partial [Deltaproteobacteria bacterium]|nr:patatin family protein [Deltaproteobacteria bacterium]
NSLMDEIDAREASGEIFVIRPKIDLHVGKAERDARRLNVVYQQGMKDAEDHFSDLEAYLKV